MSTTDKRKALGRGLETLLPTARPASTAGEGAREIPLELIDRNPYQTRGRIQESALEELTASIRASGVVQPIVVRAVADGRFQLIAGQRRWLASQRAGKTSIPAVVRAVSNEQALEMTIIENLQREDLNPMEQARAFERLAREFGLTQEQMAAKTGKERSGIANFLRLLKLPPMVQMEIEGGALSFGHAKVLMTLDQPEIVTEVARRVIEGALSVRQTEDLCFNLNHPVERAPAKAREVDANVRAAERELAAALGVRVVIRDRKGKGKITLHYTSLEDFDRILEALAPKRRE
ncbi:MAG TPA: ParB/RepB/Spo0J family partition protein [Terriglobales bacterium]|jgi:ParB family chromosome partitioning protein|nr:ParB/RepB/Spo0J family partition protein [Terriglobales bacterium]